MEHLLLTGAAGYVGRRLLRSLEAHGRRVRCLVRRPEALRETAPATEVVVGDLLDEGSLHAALDGVTHAYYLVHSMSTEGEFAERDRQASRAFGSACRKAGVRRIVYLGGLGRGDHLSEHLSSRQEVGTILRSSGVPVVELRAAVIVGAGSLSFELVRGLVDKLPVLVTPTWVRTPTQPIAIDDVVAYLEEALEVEPAGIYEIGGADRLSYDGLLRGYARARGLRRLLIPVPLLSPALSALWLSLVCPRQARVGRALIDGVRNETVVTDPAAERVFRRRPTGIDEALHRAIAETPPAEPALRGRRSLAALGVSLLCCLGAGAAGGVFTRGALSPWYDSLAKPSWTPPPGVFGPVWTALYVLMGLAAWRVWRRDGLREGRLALGVFGIQLVLNAAWPAIFFGARAPGTAFVEILLVWATVVAAASLMAVRSTLAGLLLVPSLAWLTFAVALNGAIWRMNAA